MRKLTSRSRVMYSRRRRRRSAFMRCLRRLGRNLGDLYGLSLLRIRCAISPARLLRLVGVVLGVLSVSWAMTSSPSVAASAPSGWSLGKAREVEP